MISCCCAEAAAAACIEMEEWRISSALLHGLGAKSGSDGVQPRSSRGERGDGGVFTALPGAAFRGERGEGGSGRAFTVLPGGASAPAGRAAAAPWLCAPPAGLGVIAINWEMRWAELVPRCVVHRGGSASLLGRSALRRAASRVLRPPPLGCGLCGLCGLKLLPPAVPCGALAPPPPLDALPLDAFELDE